MRAGPDLFGYAGPAGAPRGELIVDSFAGGGGASTGIEMALGRSPDVAINHDAWALAVHAANHPACRHLSKNVWQVDPLEAVSGHPVGLAWFSPDCKHFSKAKGGKPVRKSVRDLAWVVVLWAKRVRPRVIILENVEEFRDWGPITAEGRPCPERKGQTFERWAGELKRLGYRVEHRELRACDYGAPTTRKRLFLIARRDGRPIVWPAPTHGKPDDPEVIAGRKRPWRTAAEIIDWSLPCPSIFATAAEIKRDLGITAKRPLAEATMARIAKGVWRYVVTAKRPFIVPITHAGDVRVHSADEPLRTITTARRGELAVVAPVMVKNNFGDKPVSPVDEPVRTICTGGNHLMVAPYMVPRYGERPSAFECSACGEVFRDQHATGVGGLAPAECPVCGEEERIRERPAQEPRTHAVDDPLPAIVPTGNGGSLVAPVLAAYYGEGDGGSDRAAPADEPVRTVTVENRHAVVAPVLVGVGSRAGQSPPCAADEPVRTITTTKRGDRALVAAHLTKFRQHSIGSGLDEPAPTITANSYVKRPGGAAPVGVVSAFLAQHNTGVVGHALDGPVSTITAGGMHGVSQQALVAAHLQRQFGASIGSDCDEPVGTITAGGAGKTAIAAAHLVNLRGSDRRDGAVDAPCPTVSAGGSHVAEVRAFLTRYYGEGGQWSGCDEPAPTDTTKPRFGLVTVAGVDYEIVDIGMRMLTPRERFNAQSFPPGYVIDVSLDGKPITLEIQGRLVGNSVCPVMAEALVAANCSDLAVAREAAE